MRLHDQACTQNAARHARSPKRHAIILAGGRGTRLASMTRELTGRPTPKQFCAFTPDGATLLQRTCQRARAVAPGTTRVVVGREHRAIAKQQLDGHASCRLLAQPADRGTALGLLLALADLAVYAPDAEVIVLPADHGFSDEAVLTDTIDAAFEGMRKEPERITLLAAEADRAATDYGWIVPERHADGPTPVARFVEKPDATTAARLLEDGCTWSTMMLVSTVRGLFQPFRRRDPRLVAMFLHHAALPPSEQPAFLERTYDAVSPVDLSADVLEQAASLWMMKLPQAAGWSDLGTEDRMRAWLRDIGNATPGASGVRSVRRTPRSAEPRVVA